MTRESGELVEIRKELREVRWYVEDDELRDEIDEWIQDSHDQDDADTAAEFVERALNRLLAEYEMYHAPELGRGEDAFPDKCSDCRHYGAACPVLLDDTEVRWRERKLDQADGEQEARRIYQQQAIDVSCKLIPERLEEWDANHSGFISEGQDLLSRAEEHIRDDEGPSSSDDVATLADGGDRT